MKGKCTLMKEGSKKGWRVHSKGVESLGVKKNEKGEGKEMAGGKKWKRDENKEVETQESWRSFVMERMMKLDLVLERLVKENEELWKEVSEMRKENMEDRREYFRRLEKYGRIQG